MVEAITSVDDKSASRRGKPPGASRQKILDVAAKLFRARGYTEPLCAT